ncbi:MAG: hypothetical protein IK077_00595 [Thermoguttaceae bacterium]|nr:hypothetical protein [Thermoguttaceae bacterium]
MTANSDWRLYALRAGTRRDWLRVALFAGGIRATLRASACGFHFLDSSRRFGGSAIARLGRAELTANSDWRIDALRAGTRCGWLRGALFAGGVRATLRASACGFLFLESTR